MIIYTNTATGCTLEFATEQDRDRYLLLGEIPSYLGEFQQLLARLLAESRALGLELQQREQP